MCPCGIDHVSDLWKEALTNYSNNISDQAYRTSKIMIQINARFILAIFLIGYFVSVLSNLVKLMVSVFSYFCITFPYISLVIYHVILSTYG